MVDVYYNCIFNFSYIEIELLEYLFRFIIINSFVKYGCIANI